MPPSRPGPSREFRTARVRRSMPSSAAPADPVPDTRSARGHRQKMAWMERQFAVAFILIVGLTLLYLIVRSVKSPVL